MPNSYWLFCENKSFWMLIIQQNPHINVHGEFVSCCLAVVYYKRWDQHSGMRCETGSDGDECCVEQIRAGFCPLVLLSGLDEPMSFPAFLFLKQDLTRDFNLLPFWPWRRRQENAGEFWWTDSKGLLMRGAGWTGKHFLKWRMLSIMKLCTVWTLYNNSNRYFKTSNVEDCSRECNPRMHCAGL